MSTSIIERAAARAAKGQKVLIVTQERIGLRNFMHAILERGAHLTKIKHLSRANGAEHIEFDSGGEIFFLTAFQVTHGKAIDHIALDYVVTDDWNIVTREPMSLAIYSSFGPHAPRVAVDA